MLPVPEDDTQGGQTPEKIERVEMAAVGSGLRQGAAHT
jgi:hypothetical protein